MSQRSKLYQELVQLRSRRGVERPDLDVHHGPCFRSVCGVAPGDRESRVRQSVRTTLDRLIAGLSPDLQDAARLAFALDRDHRYPTLAERQAQLARRQNRSMRTGRRLMDEALAAIVEAAEPAAETRPHDPGPGWRVASLRVRFPAERVPGAVWLLNAVPYLELKDRAAGSARLRLSPAGDVVHDFTGQREGYGYGVAWAS